MRMERRLKALREQAKSEFENPQYGDLLEIYSRTAYEMLRLIYDLKLALTQVVPIEKNPVWIQYFVPMTREHILKSRNRYGTKYQFAVDTDGNPLLFETESDMVDPEVWCDWDDQAVSPDLETINIRSSDVIQAIG